MRIEELDTGTGLSITDSAIHSYYPDMDTRRFVARFLVMSSVLLVAWNSQATVSSVSQAMIGSWEGDARIIVSWCRQTNLHVRLDIRSDGSVTGKVGDATLLKGRLSANRGTLGRKLNLATDHIIKGELSGPVVAAEGISRKGVSIPLNFTRGTFVGGVHTSGSKFGGRKRMILSASSLTLKRAE